MSRLPEVSYLVRPSSCARAGQILCPARLQSCACLSLNIAFRAPKPAPSTSFGYRYLLNRQDPMCSSCQCLRASSGSLLRARAWRYAQTHCAVTRVDLWSEASSGEGGRLVRAVGYLSTGLF